MSAQGSGSTVRYWHFGESLEPIRALLERGGILAIPTESSYGLAVDPRSAKGVAAIFRVKGRAPEQPLPVVVADLGQAEALGVEVEHPLVARVSPFWPAALTALVPLRAESSLPAAAGSSRLGFRIPDHAELLELLRRLGHGLTATSANRSGEPPLLEAEGVARLLEGHDSMVIAGPPLPGGDPSTVVDWVEGTVEIVRPGRVPASVLRGRDLPHSRRGR